MGAGADLISLSPLDEERFGIRTARASSVLADSIPKVLKFCRENQVTFAICRCSVSEPGAVQALESAGFLLMDTLIYYVRDVRTVERTAEAGQVFVQPFQLGEEEAVLRVAAEAFHNYSSHYHADPRLDRRKCDEVYSSWAFRTCVTRGVADQVLVAKREGAIAGFASLRFDSTEEANVLLFAVGPEWRGRGFARSLLAQTLGWCQAKGFSRLLYSTQVTNWAAQKMLVRLGFEPIRASYTFHKWFDRT